MGIRDPRVDGYIAGSEPFARPVLSHLRELVHRACPDVEETMKWSFPHFMYRGILCSMAAFRAHCAFGFWKGAKLAERHAPLARAEEEAMGHLGRIASKADLPSDRTLLQYIKEAMALNEQGVKAAEKRRAPRPPLRTPADLAAALRGSRRATKVWKAFPPSHRREYVEWITEARQEATRARRLAQAIEWIADGKPRNWKYLRK